MATTSCFLKRTLRGSERKRTVYVSVSYRTAALAAEFRLSDSQSSNPGSIPGILGDFGLIFVPDQPERPTMTDERVGPRDYMPQWADLGERLENVQTNFDVYMLGKLLWCMVTGRLKLPREYHKRPAYDVTVLFPDDPNMRKVNEILEKCVVEEPQHCLRSAQELLVMVDDALVSIQKGIPMLDGKGKLVLPCRVCGRGFYQEHNSVQLKANDSQNRGAPPIPIRMFVCNICRSGKLVCCFSKC